MKSRNEENADENDALIAKGSTGSLQQSSGYGSYDDEADGSDTEGDDEEGAGGKKRRRRSAAQSTGVTEEDWDDEKYIWDRKDLERVNRRRLNKDAIPVVLRDDRVTMGIRAHPDMNYGRTTCSIFNPAHNEFVNIWLFLIFATYMWIQVILILAKVRTFYDLEKELDYMLIFLVTFGIAASMTASAVYLIYYPMSKDMRTRLETINLQFILVMGYLTVFVFLASEWFDRQPVVFYFLFITALVAVASLVLVEYEGLMRSIVLYFGIGWVSLMLLIDMAAWATPRQLKVFYLPFLIELLIFSVGIILLFFEVPERWCKDSRVVSLYLCSQIIYTILLINFLFELQSIMYYTIKSNDGDLKDEGTWWAVKNVYE